MHNLGQLKSRQFIRRPSIEPIARASSFHTIDNRRLERHVKLKNKQSQNENIINLANIMQEIQQLKPKTAHRIEQNKNSRNRRAETLVPGIPKMKSKNNPVSIIDLLKQHRQGKDEFKTLNTIQQRGEQKINSRIAIQRKSLDKNIELKRNSEQVHEYQVNFETIRFPEGVCKADLVNQAQKVNAQNQNQVEQYQDQKCKEKLLPKNMTEYAFRPQNKITINNIDKLIFINSKGKKSPKNTKRTEKDTIKFSQKQKLWAQKSFLENEEESQPVVVPKQKKTIINERIPQFIKASLQGYKQQSQYSNFILLNKITQNKTVGHKDEYPPLLEKQQNIQNEQSEVQIEEKRSQQNLLGEKLNLVQKQKRKSSKIIDYIRQRRQNNTIAIESAKPIFKVSSRSKPKTNYLQDDFNHKICGWEETDPPAAEPMDFKT